MVQKLVDRLGKPLEVYEEERIGIYRAFEQYLSFDASPKKNSIFSITPLPIYQSGKTLLASSFWNRFKVIKLGHFG